MYLARLTVLEEAGAVSAGVSAAAGFFVFITCISNGKSDIMSGFSPPKSPIRGPRFGFWSARTPPSMRIMSGEKVSVRGVGSVCRGVASAPAAPRNDVEVSGGGGVVSGMLKSG